MATVVVINGRHRGEWYSVPESARGLVFGRDDKLLAEIIDPRVSHQHMRVYKDPKAGAVGGYVVEDMDSRNGTRVNGKSIKVHDLMDKDLIQIGHTLIGFSEQDIEGEDLIEGFVERMRSKAGPALDQIENREQYTEAAALFSRIFRRPGSDKKKKKR